MINCHNYHKYFSNNEEWEFIWIHLKGSAVAAMFDVLYPNAVNIISVKDFLSFEQQLSELICNVTKNDVLSSISTSSQIHDVLNTLVIYTIENEQKSQKRQHSDDINVVIDFIQNNYSDSISVDDMIQNIHISKYHFIRLFHRIMGTTPYNYLTNYRINKSKLLLRTTNKSIAEISEECRFLDTSNFISQFKRIPIKNQPIIDAILLSFFFTHLLHRECDCVIQNVRQMRQEVRYICSQQATVEQVSR